MPKNFKIRKKFTKHEDSLLKERVSEYGLSNWALVAMYIPNRTPKQCRDRYTNYLRDDLSFSEWTENDEIKLINLFNIYGPKWAAISSAFGNRSENDLKNKWYRHMKMGSHPIILSQSDKKQNEVNLLNKYKNDVKNSKENMKETILDEPKNQLSHYFDFSESPDESSLTYKYFDNSFDDTDFFFN
ncbi:Myb-like DNA-binding domain containing protein [Tritrichomonas foetus]|uniref:Myb-like DNA-binding domain containing protein n=1 Tax=Tritrichomonas foetus TaxID=1144522 RepID=A0A1J4J2U8_9EUKA|nr:Myb-like DNA-binding domain containing protein [Tritrichomonas foetus]|eukprot:OHS93065.1 Myb-like DNA-binding domain containing protein [Tritrichomonas foetus]